MNEQLQSRFKALLQFVQRLVPPGPVEEPKACDFCESKHEGNGNVQAFNEPGLDHGWCDDRATAEFILEEWEAVNKSQLDTLSAYELNDGGCLYIWAGRPYENAMKLFVLAGEKAENDPNHVTPDQKEIIAKNLKLVGRYIP